MTDSVHPAPGVLADLAEGLLGGAELDVVRDHVDSCTQCRAELAALDEVRTLLAGVGEDAPPMPAEVAERLDAAIGRAQEERATGIPSLDEHREQRRVRRSAPPPAPVRRRGRSILIGGAAAAAVIVLGGVVVDGVGDLGASDGDDAGGAADSTSSDTDSGDSLLGAPEQESLDAPDAAREGAGPQDDYNDLDSKAQRLLRDRLFTFDQGTPTLSPDNASAYAVELTGTRAAKSRTGTVPRACKPLARQTTAAKLSSRSRVAEVRWADGDEALLVVDPKRRVADVYGCGTDPRLVYTTSY